MTLLFWLRTILLYFLLAAWTIPWATGCLFFAPFMTKFDRHRFAVRPWCLFTIWLCRVICGITWRVEGYENIPQKPCVVACNHQSSWETFFLQTLLTPQSTVIKKELLSIPFFGWAFRVLNPIAIDRSNIRLAMQQVVEQGTGYINDGMWVLIFPEGTRHNWPEVGKFNGGAALLAKKAKADILPVAHNAGRYWPHNSLLKKPGEITIHIGKPVTAEGKAGEITAQVHEWIEAQQNR